MAAAVRRGRSHNANGAGPRKQLGYRPDEEVYALVKQAAESAGRTISAEIDATLKRAYDQSRQDRAELEDLFGGPEGFAYGYLMARIRTAIEAECMDEALVDEQMKAAHDFIVTTADGKTEVGQIKHSTPTMSNEPGSTRSVGVAFISFAGGSTEPWHRVLTAVARNLSNSGSDLWWPLSDHPKQRRRAVPAEPPLRPTIEQLRAVCPLRIAPKTAAS